MAPHANIISYQVCWPGGSGDPYAGCPTSAILAAVEQAAIDKLLREKFALRDEEARSLHDLAVTEQSEANQLLGFTRTIKDRYSLEERIELIEMIWEVVYADGELHDYEANLLRRLGGLLYVSDRERGDARKRVLARLR